MIVLQLPFPPSANNLYPSAKNGRRFLSKIGKDYHAAVHACVLDQLRRYPKLAHRIAVTYAVNPPDKRRRDAGNWEKILSDSLTQAGVWLDDSQIDDLRIVRGEPVPGGQVTVTIRQIIDARGV